MAKGYMIFVEGGDAPKKVHININSAWREMTRLAALMPDKEIMIMRLEKRMMGKAGNEKPVSIGSHIPPENINSTVDTKHLILGSELRKRKAGKEAA